MYEGQSSGRNAGRKNEYVVNLADIALRGTTVLWNIQFDAIRTLWEMQARNAAAFGIPDYSGVLRSADGSMKGLLATSTDQILSSVHLAGDTINEMQQQFSQLIQQRSQELSEEMRRRIEELSERSRQGLEQVQNMARQGAQEAQRAGARGEESPVEQPRPEGEREERSARQRRAA